MPSVSTSKPLHRYNKAFRDELKKLNKEQRAAVDQIDGPVMVIAGPGTGKTHILSARIGRILMETDSQAHNILCLTFTDAGVQAMRNRLLELIGPEAHRVHIFTFHSFCNSIIQDRLDLFGYHDMAPVSELEKVEIIRKIIDELKVNHPLTKGKASDPYYYEQQLADLFSKMKSENWTVKYVHKKIDEYLKSLPKREDFIYKRKSKENKPGDLKQAKFQAEKTRMKLLKSAASLFPAYVDKLSQGHRYDFDDMILWVLKAFEKHPALLRQYQEQYLYLLVDEFQDTNGSQNEIINQLTSYWESPNIFLVGDDDQSIYEFQGARLKNLIDFYQRYKEDISLVLLKRNYRSSQSILNLSKSLIDNNEKRIVNQIDGLSKNLVAANKISRASKEKPLIVTYPNRFHEITDIVSQIEESKRHGTPLNEIAVIYARHKQSNDLIRLLEKKGVAYNTRRQVNILNLPLIQNLRNLLSYIQKEFEVPFNGEHLLYQIMHYQFLGIASIDLAKLNAHMVGFDYTKRPTWRSIINDPSLLKSMKLQNAQALSAFAEFINERISEQGSLSLVTITERIINRSGLLDFVLQQEDKNWLLQVLNTFFNFVKKESERNPRITLSKFLETLRNMDANRIALPIQKTVLMQEGVNLMTAHGSKGLEFKQVFMLDCTKEIWEMKRNSGQRFYFPDTLTYSGEEDLIEARRRLFYVAATRAKTKLQISFSAKNEEGKPQEKTSFIDEVLEGEKLEMEIRHLSESEILEAKSLMLEENLAPSIAANDKTFIAGLLENFTLSISSLNTFLRCPLSFYYEYILQVPSSTSASAAYGTAMHESLRRLFDKMAKDKNQSFGSLGEFLKYFEHEMKGLEYLFSKQNYATRLAVGKENLSSFYHQNIEQWPKAVLIEHYIRNVELEGIPLKGTIDRVDLHNHNMVHIVDYKTGSQAPKKTAKPTVKNPLGGDYWRQLVFYKILYESKYPGSEVLSAAIDYLEPDRSGEFISRKITFRDGDKNKVAQMIKEAYKKIMNQEFYTGCGEKNCVWCNFVKHTQNLNSLADPNIELLDD